MMAVRLLLMAAATPIAVGLATATSVVRLHSHEVLHDLHVTKGHTSGRELLIVLMAFASDENDVAIVGTGDRATNGVSPINALVYARSAGETTPHGVEDQLRIFATRIVRSQPEDISKFIKWVSKKELEFFDTTIKKK